MTGRGRPTPLTRATAVLAALFFVTSLTLAVMSHRSAAPKSILDTGAPAKAGSQQAPAGADNLLDTLRKAQDRTPETAPAQPAAPAQPSGPRRRRNRADRLARAVGRPASRPLVAPDRPEFADPGAYAACDPPSSSAARGFSRLANAVLFSMDRAHDAVRFITAAWSPPLGKGLASAASRLSFRPGLPGADAQARSLPT